MDPDSSVRGADPDPHQNVTDPQHCPEGTRVFFFISRFFPCVSRFFASTGALTIYDKEEGGASVWIRNGFSPDPDPAFKLLDPDPGSQLNQYGTQPYPDQTFRSQNVE